MFCVPLGVYSHIQNCWLCVYVWLSIAKKNIKQRAEQSKGVGRMEICSEKNWRTVQNQRMSVFQRQSQAVNQSNCQANLFPLICCFLLQLGRSLVCSFTPKPTPETFFKSSFNTVEKCARGVRSNAYSSIREQEKLCTRLLFPHTV